MKPQLTKLAPITDAAHKVGKRAAFEAGTPLGHYVSAAITNAARRTLKRIEKRKHKTQNGIT